MTNTQKIKIPAFNDPFSAVDYIRLMLNELGHHIQCEDIESSYNQVYEFYQVSIFRHSKVADGTFEERECRWNSLKTAVLDNFELSGAPQNGSYHTWRWIGVDKHLYDFDGIGRSYIPGLTFHMVAVEQSLRILPISKSLTSDNAHIQNLLTETQ